MGESFKDRTARDPEGAWDRIKPVIEEMKAKEPTAEAVAEAIQNAREAGFVLGAKVKLQGGGPDEEVGEVLGFNEQTLGLYNGVRYPIYVKWERGTFEYGPDALELIA